MAATAIIAAIGLAAALGTTAYGIAQQQKAKKIAAGNIRPTLAINPEVQSNQQIAQSLQGQGLSDSVLSYYRTGAERGLSSSIDAILKGGGDNNTVGQVYGAYNDSLGRLAVADDARRYNNVLQLLDQNRRMSGERDKLFQFNEYAPFADKAQEAALMSQQGAQYIQSGINTGVSAIGTYASGVGQQGDINNLNGGSGGSSTGNRRTIDTVDPYAPSLMNSGAGQAYMNNNAYNFNKLTPKQQADISGLYFR